MEGVFSEGKQNLKPVTQQLPGGNVVPLSRLACCIKGTNTGDVVPPLSRMMACCVGATRHGGAQLPAYSKKKNS